MFRILFAELGKINSFFIFPSIFIWKDCTVAYIYTKIYLYLYIYVQKTGIDLFYKKFVNRKKTQFFFLQKSITRFVCCFTPKFYRRVFRKNICFSTFKVYKDGRMKLFSQTILLFKCNLDLLTKMFWGFFCLCFLKIIF